MTYQALYTASQVLQTNIEIDFVSEGKLHLIHFAEEMDPIERFYYTRALSWSTNERYENTIKIIDQQAAIIDVLGK